MTQAIGQDIPQAVRAVLCEAFSVDPSGQDEWIISSPFLFRDGDGFPVYLRRAGSSWVLTDSGAAASHLFFDDFELTDARLRHLEALAETNGLALRDQHVIVRTLDHFPDAYEIADVLVAIAQVGALPHVQSETSDVRYRTAARLRVAGLLSPEQQRREHWRPQQPHGDLWVADLWMPTEDRPVAAFMVGNTPRADRVAATVSQYTRWNLRERPIVAYKPSLASNSVSRLQDAVADDQAVVALNPELAETGALGIRRVLAERGVLVAAA